MSTRGLGVSRGESPIVRTDTRAHTVHMRTFAESQALRAIELATTPLVLIGAAVVIIVVFTGVAGRIALYLEALLQAERR